MRDNMSQEAYELALFIENDADLYRQQTLPIIENLQKKITKGTYDTAKTVKLWKYLADNGAKKYTFEHGDRGNARNWQSLSGFGVFTPAMRKEVAGYLEQAYLEHVQQGYVSKAKAGLCAKNPAPRIGTARPRRASQITKKAPSKRLVARRVVNTRKGYFPNPLKLPADLQRDVNEMFEDMGAGLNDDKMTKNEYNALNQVYDITEAQWNEIARQHSKAYELYLKGKRRKTNPLRAELDTHKNFDIAHSNAIKMLERIEKIPKHTATVKLQAELSFAQGFINGIKEAGAVNGNEAAALLKRLHEIFKG